MNKYSITLIGINVVAEPASRNEAISALIQSKWKATLVYNHFDFRYHLFLSGTEIPTRISLSEPTLQSKGPPKSPWKKDSSYLENSVLRVYTTMYNLCPSWAEQMVELETILVLGKYLKQSFIQRILTCDTLNSLLSSFFFGSWTVPQP